MVKNNMKILLNDIQPPENNNKKWLIQNKLKEGVKRKKYEITLTFIS